MFLKQSQGNPNPSPSLVFQTYKGGEGGPSDSSLAHEGREWCPLLSATFKWGSLEEPRLNTSKRGKTPGTSGLVGTVKGTEMEESGPSGSFCRLYCVLELAPFPSQPPGPLAPRGKYQEVSSFIQSWQFALHELGVLWARCLKSVAFSFLVFWWVPPPHLLQSPGYHLSLTPYPPTHTAVWSRVRTQFTAQEVDRSLVQP